MGGHAKGNTSYQLIIPAAAETYEVDRNQEFILGDRIGSATLPEYPPTLIEMRLPTQIVCIEMDIGTDGHVFDSRPLYGSDGCLGESEAPDARFLAATKAAISHWSFRPARMCTFPEGASHNETCEGKNVRTEVVPVRLAFLFHFSLDNKGAHVQQRELLLKQSN